MAPYTVINASTGDDYGPFEDLREAQTRAADFHFYEIVNEAGDLVDWSGRAPSPAKEA